LSPDNTKLYVPGLNLTTLDTEIWVVDSATGTVLQTAIIPVISVDSQIAITPDGQYVYVTGGLPATDVYQIHTTTLSVNLVSVGMFSFDRPIGVTIDQNGQFAYVANFDALASSVDVIDIASNSIIAQIVSPFISSPFGIAIAPDGAFVYVANDQAEVAVINTSNFVVSNIPTTQTNLRSVAMAPLCFNGLVKGRVGRNRDFWQTEVFSQLCWTLSTTVRPNNFLIYRNDKLIETVSGDTSSFQDHNLKRDKKYVYSIYASNVPGAQFLVGTITLKTK